MLFFFFQGKVKMSTRCIAVCPDVVILNGQVNSNIVLSYNVYEDAETFALFFVAGGDVAKTYKFQVSNDGGVTFVDWTDGAALIAAPVSASSTYGPPAASAFRIVASAAVAAQTSWKMNKSFLA